MAETLAVVWRKMDREPSARGRLELHTDRLRLEGTRSGHPVSEDLPLREITRTRFGRGERERIGGRQTLVLEIAHKNSPLLISSVFGIGALTELVQLLGG